MPHYREKLWASAWSFIVTALVIPASILVLAPINMQAGYVTAAVLYGGCVTLLVIASPVIRVENGLITAGPATISVDLVGEAMPFSGTEASQERGPRLDVRSWMLIRGWVGPVVKIPITDETDPAPYWLVSSRHPEKLVAAINESRRPATDF
ncbi:DUF3093 domain-containing protein [Cryobacterium sp. CG_9.6]|uniref:DUF3093 domain-containing protein n=1 Tax=Cryobacterium sp. CG_9.6 TaxID=2760710 RepID=UPI002473501B|nr:DUF3093 domain-containing protein [Cryobacterium sp. CG_9.6]MDH6237342.1 hypothetical protein [Cryobacterium sp. CG_9.6]